VLFWIWGWWRLEEEGGRVRRRCDRAGGGTLALIPLCQGPAVDALDDDRRRRGGVSAAALEPSSVEQERTWTIKINI
jgi:hypothetical protein